MPFAAAARELDSIISRFRMDLKQMRYLGPVRATPKRAYVHYTSHYELEHDGSNAVQILWLRQNDKVRWGPRLGRKPLIEAVNQCLKMLGLVQNVTPKQFQRIVYQLRVQTLSDTKKSVTIADVGFGFSQLLPVILRGLLSPVGLILFEQPEIHLHPACAGRLADLFLHFIRSGKQILVETHSMELINRLRLRIVEEPQLGEKVNILFVSPPSQPGKGSSIEQLRINADGMPDNWPEGFCDESANLTRAIIEARRVKSKTG
jgi:predicted ATPase